MEKKIERVPYISKWYKEEQKDELLNFAFDEQNAGSDFDVDKFSLYDKNLYTYSTNTTNGLWTTGYSKPTVQLNYVCKLTQWDIEHINKLINLAIDNFERAEKNPIEDGHCFGIGLIDLEDLTNFINNKNGVLDKCQKEQLDFIKKK